jgi:hypothetical protein
MTVTAIGCGREMMRKMNACSGATQTIVFGPGDRISSSCIHMTSRTPSSVSWRIVK